MQRWSQTGNQVRIVDCHFLRKALGETQFEVKVSRSGSLVESIRSRVNWEERPPCRPHCLIPLRSARRRTLPGVMRKSPLVAAFRIVTRLMLQIRFWGYLFDYINE